MSTTQDIAAIAKKALEDTNNATESDWPGIFAGALESIVELCQFEQMDVAKASQLPERDTRFAGFAAALVDDIRRNIDMNTDLRLPYEQLIAKRAYDLVEHAARETHPLASMSEIHTIVDRVPDMAVLPEPEEQEQ